MPNQIATLALTLTHGFGLNAMYGLAYRNGYYDDLIRLRDVGPHHLPGSLNPVLTRYCGISPLDDLLTLASVMFANITDGSCPQLSVYAIQFGGQFLGILNVITMEAQRKGNQSNTFRL
jgi:hypothetical protein